LAPAFAIKSRARPSSTREEKSPVRKTCCVAPNSMPRSAFSTSMTALRSAPKTWFA